MYAHICHLTGRHSANMQDYCTSRENLESSVNFGRQASCNVLDPTHNRNLDGSQSQLDQSWDHRHNTAADMDRSPSLYSHHRAASPYSHM